MSSGKLATNRRAMQSQELSFYKPRPENFKDFFRVFFTISDSGQAWNFLGIDFLSVFWKFSIHFFLKKPKYSNWDKEFLNSITIFPNGLFQINWIISLPPKKMVLLPWIPMLIHGLVSQTWALFISLSKYNMRILQNTGLKKRENMDTRRKETQLIENIYRLLWHRKVWTQDCTNLSIQNIWKN